MPIHVESEPKYEFGHVYSKCETDYIDIKKQSCATCDLLFKIFNDLKYEPAIFVKSTSSVIKHRLSLAPDYLIKIQIISINTCNT